MYQSTILANKTQIHSDFLDDNIWNLLDNTYSLPSTFDYGVFEVTNKKYIARPDLVSFDLYGDSMFADIICKLNGISNPFELNVGMTLIVPSALDIPNFAHTPDVNDIENENVISTTPKPKQKTDRRQANDAVIGDKRFKIDATKGIVVY
jgi:hypothetical protein